MVPVKPVDYEGDMLIGKAKAARDAVWFVPDVLDNRQSDEPFAVLLSPMTYAEKRQLEVETLGEPLKKRGESFLARAHKFQDELFTKHVLDVKGYAVDQGEGEMWRPRTGKDLLRTLLAQDDALAEQIVVQILEAIRDTSALEEGAEGKFGSRRSSTSPLTSAGGDGAARAARETAT